MSEIDYEKDRIDNNRALRSAEGGIQHHVDMFGDELAERYGYKKHRGIEAVWWFLIEKYQWKPYEVRALNFEDLAFLMEEERASRPKKPTKSRD